MTNFLLVTNWLDQSVRGHIENTKTGGIRDKTRNMKVFLAGFMGKDDKDLFDEAGAMRYKMAKVYRLFDVGSPSRANS